MRMRAGRPPAGASPNPPPTDEGPRGGTYTQPGTEMPTVKERYLTDESGEPVSVVLDLTEYRKLLDQIEELESIRAYDAAKSSGETPIPFDEALLSEEGP